MIKYRTLDIHGLWNKVESLELKLKDLIPRLRLRDISKRFNSNLIEVVSGPRQSGKTTLLQMLIHDLIARGVSYESIFYVNLDTIIEMEQFENPLLFVKQLEDIRQGEERLFVFIDEVQRLKYPGKFLKGIYDLNKNIKLFVSGSSSLEIKSKVKEFLTGRKRETYLLPLSFKEYIDYERNIPKTLASTGFSENSLLDWGQNEQLYGKYLKEKMEDMALYGGYPAVLKKKEEADCVEELSEIYQSYVKRDIIDLLQIGKSEVFNQLVKVLATQAGNLVNKSEICSLIGSNNTTITKYMDMLKETYITEYLPPYVSSRRNEIKSAHKCFFIDNGLRNFSIRQFNQLKDRTDSGALLENLIFTEWMKNRSWDEELFFWRTKAGAEVDFVLAHEKEIIPIEVKAGSAKAGLLSKSFHAFLEYYSPDRAIFLNRDLFHLEKVKKTWVYYLPVHWFLLFGVGLILD